MPLARVPEHGDNRVKRGRNPRRILMNTNTDDTLVNKKCVPCHGGVSALSKAEADSLLSRLLSGAGHDEGWKIVEDGKALKREFKFADFYRAMSFVNTIT